MRKASDLSKVMLSLHHGQDINPDLESFFLWLGSDLAAGSLLHLEVSGK